MIDFVLILTVWYTKSNCDDVWCLMFDVDPFDLAFNYNCDYNSL